MDRHTARVNRPRRRAPGAGFAPFPKHTVLRVNDLLPPDVDVTTVRAALAARGVPVGDRDVPVGRSVRALVVPTAAGAVVTLERREGFGMPRSRVLRHLTRLWEGLAAELLDGARHQDETGQNRTQRLDLAE